MEEHVESLYNLRQDIEAISSEQQERLIHFLTIKDMVFTENSNGVFFNLSSYTKEQLDDLRVYIESVKDMKPLVPINVPQKISSLRMPGVNPIDWIQMEKDHVEDEVEMPKIQRRVRAKASKPTKQQQRIMKRMREFTKKHARAPVRQRKQNQQHETEDFVALDDDCEDGDMEYEMDENYETNDVDYDDDLAEIDYGEECRDIEVVGVQEEIQSDYDEEEVVEEVEEEFVHNELILQDVLKKIPATLPLSSQWKMFVDMFPSLKNVIEEPQWM
jgi:hypothetical protein